MANVAMNWYVVVMAKAHGAPSELETLDSLAVDFVRDVADGRLDGAAAREVAVALNDRSNAVAVAKQAEEDARAEEAYRARRDDEAEASAQLWGNY